ncbi:hypothetical protein HYH03_001673 [Edaphochlamys debaryana]|uniref:EGF-like domain-containing protein n=1 Tax=Edaphochlamys debaryana TaxID=47281 RepID=A0A835YBV9_9CHLO|nr:hypothetical protein HYH03_001673 [Edaphochlamys debaryana]|eukprot:KAG2500087.1 hypothetical protein HYH03_001673 [Edaphochlamys debaryana]
MVARWTDECRNSTTGVATNICGAALGCVNKFGSYQCLCPPGYGYRLAQKACFANPCLTNLNACASKNNTQCVPFANMTGFTCNCIAGARLRAGGNGSCNVNPCSRNPCTRNNTVCAANADFSAFTCPCRLGSRNISNACVMNPCYSIYNDTGPCRTKPNRACVPSANYSSYTCPCIAGAKNVSNVCLLNPCNSTLACADVPNSVCQPNADYKNYTCACRPGFRAFGNRCRSDPCVPLSNATAPPCATKANTFCNATADWSNFTCPCQPFALLSAGSCKLNPCNSTRNNCTALPNTVW